MIELSINHPPDHHMQFEIVNYNLSDTSRSFDVYATKDELRTLSEVGYLKREGLISPDDVTTLSQAVDAIVNAEMEMEHREYYPGNGIFVRYLMSKDAVFQSLLKFSPILSVARAMLGPQVQIMDLVARVTFLDEDNQKLMWHIHNRVVPNPLPPFFAHPHGLDALIYLDDADANSGALCVIPESHRNVHLDLPFRDHSDQETQEVISAKAGDCIFSHSNIWHRVMPSNVKSPSKRRRVLLMGFMPSWFKKEFPKGVRPSVDLLQPLREGEDNETRELLGEFEWV